MVHKMQRLAMNVSDVSDTSSILPAAIPNRQKCATIVEEAEIDDFDDGDDDDDGQDNNDYGAEGRKK